MLKVKPIEGDSKTKVIHHHLLFLLYNDYDNLQSFQDSHSDDDQVDVNVVVQSTMEVESHVSTDSVVINPDSITMIESSSSLISLSLYSFI